MKLNPLTFAATVAFAGFAMLTTSVLGCATADVDSEESAPQVEANDELSTSRRTGAIVGSGGQIVEVMPGWNNPPYPPVSCPGSCTVTSDGNACACPLGYSYYSFLYCMWGQKFLCFNGVCACYY